MMEPNQNPPSERDWTPEEREAFFASQDAVTGIFGNCAVNNGGVHLSDIREFTIADLEKMLDAVPQQPPIEWSTGWWNGPYIELDPDDPFGDMERIFHRGIHITSIVPPEQGWPIVAHCDLCHKTEIVLSPYAAKPSDGDYFRMNGTCLDEELHWKHNMYPQKWYPWPNKPLPGEEK
jgi:hypothetical protein